MLNLVRTGSAAVLGIGSGVLDSGIVEPIKVSDTQTMSWATILEALAVVGGGVLQFTSPMTMPAVVDGLVDGGIALLAHRGSKYAVIEMRKPEPETGGWAMPGASYAVPALGGNGFAMLAGGSRAAVGNVPSSPRFVLR